MAYFEGGSLLQFFFMLLSALAIAAFSFTFGRNPGGLAKIAFFTTPIAVVITALLGFFPPSLCPVLYVLSAVLMAPVISRRVYGVIRTAELNHRVVWYISGFSAAFTVFAVWVAVSPQKEIAFFIPSLFSAIAWLGIRRTLSIPDEPPDIGAMRFTKRHMLMLAVALLVVFLLTTMARMILTHVFAGSGDAQSNTALDVLITWVPAAVILLLFGIINDRAYERAGFICVMGLSLFGCIFALLPAIPQGAVTLMLIIAFCFGDMYVEFFAYTTPLYFFASSRRPVFISSIGCVFFLTISALLWKADVWVPELLFRLDTPLLVSTAFLIILFTILVFFLFERHRERTLAAALYALLYGKAGEEPAAGDKTEKLTKIDELFTSEERDVALLLIEGKMRSEITRSLHLSAAEADRRMDAIRAKINQMGDPDPLIAEAIAEYKLTRRETDVLRYLRRKMTNVEIAAEMYVTEETVKFHVRNLLNKLKISTRKEIETWENAFKKR